MLLDNMLEGALRKAIIVNNKAEDKLIQIIRKRRIFEEHAPVFKEWRRRIYGGGT